MFEGKKYGWSVNPYTGTRSLLMRALIMFCRVPLDFTIFFSFGYLGTIILKNIEAYRRKHQTEKF
jgi:hypothetical protein